MHFGNRLANFGDMIGFGKLFKIVYTICFITNSYEIIILDMLSLLTFLVHKEGPLYKLCS